jgi:hypothetical protein
MNNNELAALEKMLQSPRPCVSEIYHTGVTVKHPLYGTGTVMLAGHQSPEGIWEADVLFNNPLPEEVIANFPDADLDGLRVQVVELQLA